MKLAVDLHIHSALSPCAEDDMTPSNIARMAALKGLDAISVTDHNCGFNLRAASACAKEAGVLFIPGVEVNTAEETHVLVYFEELKQAEEFCAVIYESLPDIPNAESFFGRQLIMDENDVVIGMAQKFLGQSAPFSLHALQEKAREYGGLFIPAHINRQAYALLETLGFIPEDLELTTVEVRRNRPLADSIAQRYKTISSSDAHDLGQILERTEFIDAKERSVKGILDAMRF